MTVTGLAEPPGPPGPPVMIKGWAYRFGYTGGTCRAVCPVPGVEATHWVVYWLTAVERPQRYSVVFTHQLQALHDSQ